MSILTRKKCKALGKSAPVAEEQAIPTNTIGYGNSENIDALIGGEVVSIEAK